MGKSWLLLALAIARASGGLFLGKIRLEKGPVLYLALEDTEESLQDRLEKLLGEAATPAGLEFATDWREWHINQGGLEKLAAWAHAHPGGCVIVDTLAKLRPPMRANANQYVEDYTVGTQLKGIADRENCSLIVVTHNRKAKADDPFDEINASTGVAGAMDTGLVIRRERGAADAVLYTTGRRISEHSLALQFDARACQWTLMGDGLEFAISAARQSIRDAVRRLGRATPKQVALATGRNHNTVKNTMIAMAKDGELRANGDGTYSDVPRPGDRTVGQTSQTSETTETTQTMETIEIPEPCVAPATDVLNGDDRAYTVDSLASLHSLRSLSSLTGLALTPSAEIAARIDEMWDHVRRTQDAKGDAGV